MITIKYSKPSDYKIAILPVDLDSLVRQLPAFVSQILRLWRREFVVFHETLNQKTATVQQIRLQECLLCSEKLKHVRHVVLVMS